MELDRLELNPDEHRDHPAVERYMATYGKFAVERILAPNVWVTVDVTDDDTSATSLAEIDRFVAREQEKDARQRYEALCSQRIACERDLATFRRYNPGVEPAAYANHCAQALPHLRAQESAQARRLSARSHAAISIGSAPLTHGSARPRERRDGSRRHSTRGSTSNDSDGSDPEPSGDSAGRLCKECSADISHRDPRAKYCAAHSTEAARQKRSRARSRDASATDALKPGPKLQALFDCWAGRTPLIDGDIPLSAVIEPGNPTLNEILKRCGDWSGGHTAKQAPVEPPARPASRWRLDGGATYCKHCASRRWEPAPPCCLSSWLAERIPPSLGAEVVLLRSSCRRPDEALEAVAA